MKRNNSDNKNSSFLRNSRLQSEMKIINESSSSEVDHKSYQ